MRHALALSVLAGLAVAAGGGRAADSGPLIAFTTGDVGTVQNLAVAHSDGSGFHTLTEHRLGGFDPVWTTDGRWLVVMTHDHSWRVRPDGTDRHLLPGDPELGDAVSPSGQLVAQGWGIHNRRGKLIRSLWNPLGSRQIVDSALWSPDARYVALAVERFDDPLEQERTVVVRADGKRSGYAFSQRRNDEEPVAFSPDDRWLLTFVRQPGRRTALLASVETGRQRVLRGVGNSTAVTWSPDSQRLAYVKDGGVYLMRPTGGASRLLTRATAAADNGVAWSPRGDSIAVCDRTGLRLVRVVDGRARRLTTSFPCTAPSWRPNGRELAFSAANVDAVFVVGAATGKLRRVLGPSIDAGSPAWAPNRSLVAFVQLVQESSASSVCVAKPSGAGLRCLGPGDGVSWSLDSRRVVFVNPVKGSPGESGPIIVAGLDGMTRRIATGATPSWSPIGDSIAYLRQTVATDNSSYDKGQIIGSELIMVSADGTGSRVLAKTSSGDAFLDPRWAPDGSAIAVRESLYDPDTDTISDEIALVDTKTGSIRPLGLSAEMYRWSPDSSRLLLSGRRLQVLDVASGTVQTIGAQPKWSYTSAVWSPDGNRIAYTRSRTHNEVLNGPLVTDVWTVAPDGSNRRPIPHTSALEGSLAWAP